MAKENRKKQTTAESVIWHHLQRKQLGERFRRQHPIDDYIVDFVCLPLQLVIEVDGDYHLEAEQHRHDQERTSFLNAKGYTVMRFTNDEVLQSIDNVITRIKQKMQELKNNLQPSADTPSLGGGRGRLFIFAAPSGSGKSTIIGWLMENHPELNMHFSISCTSRAPRGTEKDGVEYFFITPEQFREKIERDEFVEYEEVYKDRYYGTLKSQVDKQLAEGENVIFDVDVHGAMAIKNAYGDRALSLFIQPPSVEELRKRLNGRGTDSPEVIEQRLARAEYELSFAEKFDTVIVNDDLEKAKQLTLQAVREHL